MQVRLPVVSDPIGIESEAPPERFFLPDLCEVRMMLALVLSAQLLAFTLTLPVATDDFWLHLSRVSLYAQAVTLFSATLLCVLRRPLARLALPLASTVMLALIMGLAFAVALLGGYLQRDPGEIPRLIDHLVPALRPSLTATLVAALALRYLYLQHALHQRMRDELTLRIDALQARIRPHFLFNTLNTITALIRQQPQAAEAALEDLADLFRASLTSGEPFVSLADELTLCRHYLHLESLRLGPRLRLDWMTDGLPDQALLPILTLQPLFENAVYHGVETCPSGGTIRFRGCLDRGVIELHLQNPCTGKTRRGQGLAIENTRQRLALSFGPKARLETRQSAARFDVTLRFPCLTAAPNRPGSERP